MLRSITEKTSEFVVVWDIGYNFFILSLSRYHHHNSRDRALSLGVDDGCKCLNLAETYTDTLDHCTGFAKQLLGLASIEANTLPTNLDVEMQLRQRSYSLIGEIMIYAMHVEQLCKFTYRKYSESACLARSPQVYTVSSIVVTHAPTQLSPCFDNCHRPPIAHVL